MWSELRRIAPYARRYWKTFVGGFLCVGVSLALKVLIPVWLGGTIDELRTASDGGAAGVVGAQAGGVRETVTRYGIWIALAAVGVALVRTTSRLLILGVSRRIVHDVRHDLFAQLTRLAPSFYGRTPTGHLMSRCVNDVQNVQGLTGPVFLYMVETAILYVFTLAMMLSIDPGLTLIGIAPFPFFLIYTRRQAIAIHSGSRAAQAKLGELSAKVDESLSGQHVIKTLTLEEHDCRRFAQRCDEYRELNMDVARARARILPAMIVLGSLSMGVVLAVGGPRVIRGELTLGRLVQMMIYLQMMAQPTGTLGFVISSFQRGAAALGRLREVLEFEPALREPEDRVSLPAGQGALEVRNLNVVFPPPEEVPHLSGTLEKEGDGPPNAERTVLRDVSFRVEAGETLGITGPTGSGKTTLLRVLARQLEVAAETVYLDGVDVTRLGLSEARSALGYVPQETFLFGRTLAANIALGDSGATSGEVTRAVDDSHLAADLPQLPDGLETLLGERGVNLSGGQRQRTALARVLLVDPRVVLLDDALSAVDTNTAAGILERLRARLAGRTAVVVSHRLANLIDADRILYLDDGRIVEEGTHDELLARGGDYARLWERQELRRALRAELEVDAQEASGA